MNILAVYLAVDEMKAALRDDAPRQRLRREQPSRVLPAFAALAVGLAAGGWGFLG
jgi:hypothetical protein